jgi:hypothetical protein
MGAVTASVRSSATTGDYLTGAQWLCTYVPVRQADYWRMSARRMQTRAGQFLTPSTTQAPSAPPTESACPHRSSPN